MTSAGSNLGKATTSRPTADAWCVLEMDSNQKPNIVDSVGISSAAYVQTGVLRVTFTNPERFASGAYVVLGQGELGNAGGYGVWVPQGTIQSASSTAIGLSGSCDISAIGFNVGSATSPTGWTDTPLSLRPRVNLAFFCLRSDNDIGKTGVLNYGTDTAHMSVTAPSGSLGGMVLIPGAGVAPDGTQTAVGVQVTPNSLGTRKVIQYSVPTEFKTNSKAWNGSIYVKAGDAGRVLRGASANVVFRDNSIGTSPAIRLNLETGVTAFGSASNYVSHDVIPVGNGWYRVSLANRSGPNEQGQNPGNRNFYMGLLSNFSTSSDDETNWSGNGSIEMYIWGFQFEEGSVTTPYIPASYPLTTSNLLNTIHPNVANIPPNFIITSGEGSVNIPALGTVVSKYTDIYNDYVPGATPNTCCPAPFSYTIPQIAVSPNTTYTFSLIYKTENGYTHPNFMYRVELNSSNTDTIQGGIHSDQNRISLGDGWWYAWGQFTTQSTTANLWLYSYYYQYRTQNRFYVYRASLHQGTSILPFTRVPLPLQTIVGEPNTPVPGNQDLMTAYSPGSGGFGADNRQNLLRYSQDFSNGVWTKTRVGLCGGYTAPDGTTTAFKLHEIEPSGSAPYYKSIGQAPIPFERGNIRQAYTFSVYAKAAERKYIAFNDGGFGAFRNLVVDLENGNVTENSAGWKTTTQNSGNGWWRIAVTSPLFFDNDESINTTYIGNVRRFAVSPNPGATTSSVFGPIEPGVSGSGILVWGAQLERGTVLGDYTPTTNAVAGTTYGRTAGDSDSAIVNIKTRREATAYGTIVIPPSRSVQGTPYLENEYGVKSVRAINAGTYEVEFNPPMDTSGYCVITSNEQETLYPFEPTSGAGSIPESAEYSMNVLRRVGALDDQRTRNGFRVSCLRQPTQANNPNLITGSFPSSATFPSPITWSFSDPLLNNHTNTMVDIAAESALSGALRNSMKSLSTHWVKCVKTSASNGIVAAGAPGGVALAALGYYRIKYYVMCDHPNFVSGSQVFWGTDNSAVSVVSAMGTYDFNDKGTIKLIETFYQSLGGSNSQVLRTTPTLPIGTTFYTTGIEVHRVMPFEPRGDFYQSGREQRINFMVFGGRAIRGSE